MAAYHRRVSGPYLLPDKGMDVSDKALGMLKHMRGQIVGQPFRDVAVRGAAISVGVDPGQGECRVLVDELLRGGYLETYPSPSLTAHGLYRLTDRGIAAAEKGEPRSASEAGGTGWRLRPPQRG